MPENYVPLENPTKQEITAIAGKMSVGLTREQAEQVIREQRDWDKHPENPTAEKPEAKGDKKTKA